MKTALTVALVVVGLLSVAAGVPKLMQVSSEVGFFASLGLPSAAVVAFGVLQIAAGGLLLVGRTRAWGAALAATMFLVSALMVFAAGNLAFGAISLLPVALAGFCLVQVVRGSGGAVA